MSDRPLRHADDQPHATDWLSTDDVAHGVVAAVDRVPLGAFAVRPIPGGKAQYHSRLLLALLIYAYANGIFASRRPRLHDFRGNLLWADAAGGGGDRLGARAAAAARA